MYTICVDAEWYTEVTFRQIVWFLKQRPKSAVVVLWRTDNPKLRHVRRYGKWGYAKG